MKRDKKRRIDFYLGQLDGVRITGLEFNSLTEDRYIRVTYEYDGIQTINLTPEQAKEMGFIDPSKLDRLIG